MDDKITIKEAYAAMYAYLKVLWDDWVRAV